MNAFEKVIGYETVKNELMQICDMVHNKERYEALGARMPKGVLIHGEPGLGKTLLAKCFIEECNINTYTLRNNRGAEKFIDEITDTFEKAKKNAPALFFCIWTVVCELFPDFRLTFLSFAAIIFWSASADDPCRRRDLRP